MGDNKQAKTDLHDVHRAIEKELVEQVCQWILRVVIFMPGMAATLGYLNGWDCYELVGPVAVCASGLLFSQFSLEAKTPVTAFMCVIALIAARQAIEFQGCSASRVPAIYGFIPCAMGFIH